jgi:sensor histidine kinase YesM
MFGQREKIEGEGSGIGLANVRRRLDLLFPGRHTLYAGERDNQYIIDLTIQLHENQVPNR